MPNPPIAAEVRWRLEELERAKRDHETAVDEIPLLRQEVRALSERVRVMAGALWAAVGGLVLLAAAVVVAGLPA